MTNTEKKLLSLFQQYPDHVKILATRVRAMEMLLQDDYPQVYRHYIQKVKSAESLRSGDSSFRESSELDELIGLLTFRKDKDQTGD